MPRSRRPVENGGETVMLECIPDVLNDGEIATILSGMSDEAFIDGGHIQHRRIENRMRTEESAIG